MFICHKKRIVRVDVPDGVLEGKTAEEVLEMLKTTEFPETVISDTLLVDDGDTNLVVAKEKVIFVPPGKSFSYG